MKRKISKKGKWLIACGLIVLSIACGITIYNGVNEINAKRNIQKVVSQIKVKNKKIDDNEVPVYMLNSNIEMPVKYIDGGAYIGILEIPSMSISLPVMNECNNSNLKKALCRYKGSIYKDNMIIAGHNYITFFAKIGKLNYGDEVTFEDIDGNVFKYKVSEIQLIKDIDIETMQNGNWDLTLFTCNYNGSSRVTIRCKKMV